MKAIRSKAVLLGLLGATAIVTTWVTVRSAKAGLKETINVTIVDATKEAYGALGDVRASGSSVSYMTAAVTSYPSWQMVRMAARNGGSSPITRECISYDPKLVAAAMNVKGDSYVSFSWNANGDCMHITVSQSSTLSPKLP